ncbi:uncharacterized protein LOC116167858 [Photinus pyralis]|uniref:uncharacterized protein LOC116162732 n=1 Tax=Photinus pyralis TaxID=7054 RepID=UPI001267440D|nr:uncharacterized protein LOC116162732 [Photinus pyralis]XP_031339296.1 uncharacterized protein LOC116167858 [Photinus pyralis]
MADLNVFEEKLSSDHVFCNAVITALETQLEKSSENKTARSFVRLTMAPALLQKFSWKSQKRKDRLEKKAFVELKLYQLMLGVLKKIWKISNVQRVEASVSNYIAHSRSPIPPTEESNFEKEDPMENV